MQKNSKIYVAGHRGLVGSAIWRNLAGKGYHNLIGKGVEELDLTNQNATAQFFATEKPAYVFLAAARVGGIVANNTYRAEFIYENLMIQNNVIHQAWKSGVKKLLFLGSTCIYPRDCPQPMNEEYLLSGKLEYTNEPYAIAKIAGIKMCESYNIQYNANFLSVMPTNLYGPNDNFDLEKSHVLPALIRKIHLGKCLESGDWDAIYKDLGMKDLGEGEKRGMGEGERRGMGEGEMGGWSKESIIGILAGYGITVSGSHEVSVEIWGSGAPMREFLWSDDMADACVFVMENVDIANLTTSAQDSQHHFLNIGTGSEISIRDLAFLTKEIVGFKGQLLFNTSKPDGTMRKLTNPSRLHALGWRHKVELDEGIQRLYNWYIAK
jgi:GDP-L-fucose synthase